jgi:cytochrome d ubiquinol oxidase subunit I
VGFAFAAVAALVQPFVGHLTGARLADHQPAKLAAMELAPETEQPSPLAIGGVLIDGERRFAIEIPKLGSLISRGSVDRAVQGLDAFDPEDRPKDSLVTVIHLSFQGMVGLGLSLAGLGAVYWWSARRGRDLLTSRRFLRIAVIAGPAAVACLELGWITTELGRQPWVVYGLLRVEDAVTRGSGVWITLVLLIAGYALMTVMATVTLRSMARRWREGESLELPTPYSPQARRRRRG